MMLRFDNCMKLFLLLLIWMCSFSAYSFNPQNKPINVIIPFAPGGGADSTFRHIRQYASANGITMVPTYKPGAEGMIGVTSLHEATPDGYTIGVIPATTITLYEIANPFKPVTTITGIRGGIGAYIARLDPTLKTFDDLVRVLRSGTEIKLGYGAQGQKMMLEQLIEVIPPTTPPLLVPFKGGNPVVLALLGGYIDVAWVPYIVAQSQVESGKLRLLAVTGNRLDEYPTTPVLNTNYKGWQEFDGQGISAPPNVSKEALEFWSTFFNKYLSDAQTKKDFAATNTPIIQFGPLAFRNIIDRSKVWIQKQTR